jgi:hypothetical protein
MEQSDNKKSCSLTTWNRKISVTTQVLDKTYTLLLICKGNFQIQIALSSQKKSTTKTIKIPL